MARRVVVFVVLLVAAVLIYMGYQRYDAKRSGANGAVYSADPEAGRTQVSSDPDDSSIRSARRAANPPQRQAEPPPTAPAEVPAQPAPLSANPTVPATDTIQPNPPNGMVFAGSGRYQLYRQGNITWRMNTDTGQSCILFATDEEWKKPRVYRAGCGSR